MRMSERLIFCKFFAGQWCVKVNNVDVEDCEFRVGVERTLLMRSLSSSSELVGVPTSCG